MRPTGGRWENLGAGEGLSTSPRALSVSGPLWVGGAHEGRGQVQSRIDIGLNLKGGNKVSASRTTPNPMKEERGGSRSSA